MHLLIPFAGTVSEAGVPVQAELALPNLARLLALLTPAEPDLADEASLSPPHERALARALGLAGGDGTIPWAAWLATQDGLALGPEPLGLLTPTHWQVGTDQVVLVDPEALDLDAADSRAAFEAVAPLFESEGMRLSWGAPLRWYAQHASLAGLACASIDRAIGRNIEPWLPPRGVARLLRRLQNEVQMQLYTHAVSADREAHGGLPVNSFWISGCGLPQASDGALPQVDTSLRRAALAGDWQAWAKAWRGLDAQAVPPLLAAAQSGTPVQVTLCGERASQTWRPEPLGAWQRLRRKFAAPALPPLLAAL